LIFRGKGKDKAGNEISPPDNREGTRGEYIYALYISDFEPKYNILFSEQVRITKGADYGREKSLHWRP
jgi:hypothetical protein